MRGGCVLSLLLLMVAVLGAKSQSATTGRDSHEVPIDETWETTKGDMLINLVNALENDAIPAARNLVKYLRSNDYRIVRFQLSNEARGKQIQFAKTESGIHLVLKMLKNQKTESRKLGAELIHLLATENYPLSQRIGLNAWLPDSAGIRELLETVEAGWQINADENALHAAEEAAQAVWAMIYQNSDNVEMAHDRQAGDYFRDAILYSESPRLKMWSAACLKRVISDFYNTPDGQYTSTARKILDNDRLRQEFAKDKLFVKKLVAMIKEGKVTEDLDRSQWPTAVEITDRINPSIQAWAAAGAIAALAASENNHKLIRKAGGVTELCLLKTSPCALERVEAEAALAALDADCSTDSAKDKDDWQSTEL